MLVYGRHEKRRITHDYVNDETKKVSREFHSGVIDTQPTFAAETLEEPARSHLGIHIDIAAPWRNVAPNGAGNGIETFAAINSARQWNSRTSHSRRSARRYHEPTTAARPPTAATESRDAGGGGGDSGGGGIYISAPHV